MRAKEVFEYILIELNKRKAPSLLLEDYNYFINKGISQVVNRFYNTAEANQQRSDDLRALKSSIVLTPTISTTWSSTNLLGNTYETKLPDDYFHIQNCVAEFTTKVAFNCYNIGDKLNVTVNRGTSDILGGGVNNYYNKPSYKKPFYYINNITISENYPTTDSSVPIVNTTEIAGNRYGNSSQVRMEIRYGKDSTKVDLSKLYIDYLRVPKLIILTQDEVDNAEDTSQILEFPDYICQEIINEVVILTMENASDPRLRSNVPIHQTIASPGQEPKR